MPPRPGRGRHEANERNKRMPKDRIVYGQLLEQNCKNEYKIEGYQESMIVLEIESVMRVANVQI